MVLTDAILSYLFLSFPLQISWILGCWINFQPSSFPSFISKCDYSRVIVFVAIISYRESNIIYICKWNIWSLLTCFSLLWLSKRELSFQVTHFYFYCTILNRQYQGVEIISWNSETRISAFWRSSGRVFSLYDSRAEVSQGNVEHTRHLALFPFSAKPLSPLVASTPKIPLSRLTTTRRGTQFLTHCTWGTLKPEKG